VTRGRANSSEHTGPPAAQPLRPARRQPSAPVAPRPGAADRRRTRPGCRSSGSATGPQPHNDVVPTALAAAIQHRSARHDWRRGCPGARARCRSLGPPTRGPTSHDPRAGGFRGERRRAGASCYRARTGRPRCCSLTPADRSGRRRLAAWSIPEAQHEEDEDPRACAPRGFEGEPGTPCPPALGELGATQAPLRQARDGPGRGRRLRPGGRAQHQIHARAAAALGPHAGVPGGSTARRGFPLAEARSRINPARVVFLGCPRETLERKGRRAIRERGGPESRRPEGTGAEGTGAEGTGADGTRAAACRATRQSYSSGAVARESGRTARWLPPAGRRGLRALATRERVRGAAALGAGDRLPRAVPPRMHGRGCGPPDPEAGRCLTELERVGAGGLERFGRSPIAGSSGLRQRLRPPSEAPPRSACEQRAAAAAPTGAAYAYRRGVSSFAVHDGPATGTRAQ
jgi:hypothetical protein